MKKIEAIIRTEKLDPVRQGLTESGYPGITITEIEGHGMQKGTFQRWRGEDYKVELLPKIKIEIVCKDKDLDRLVETVIEHAFTGGLGDGKIFVYDVAGAFRIRTRESGESALA